MAAKAGSSSSASRSGPPLDMSKLITADNDCDSEEEYYCPEGVKKMDHVVWAKYLQQIKDSQCFDIVDYPGHCPAVPIIPIDFQDSPLETHLLTNLATVAIQEYNKQNRRTKYQFVKILTANSSPCAGIVYYITFQVKERKRRNSSVKTFQAQVWDGIGHVTVKFCRLKKMAGQKVGIIR